MGQEIIRNDDHKPKWTPEQSAAISTNGCNLLVAAAAGAGKTAVLVQRIIEKVTNTKQPIDIDHLLVVTFTNAAATEMRERIGDAIAGALEKNPESKQLQRQFTLLHKASITTIHSFCLEVIRNNFHQIDLDPGFRIADETEALLMKMETLEELFEEQYENENRSEVFFELLECYGGNLDDRMLQEMVFVLHNFVQSSPWPKKWLHDKAEEFNVPEDADFSDTIWAKALLKNVKIELMGFLHAIEQAKDIIKTDDALMPYLACFEEDGLNIRNLIQKCSGRWDELYNAFENMTFGTLSRCKKDVDKEKQEKVKNIRQEIKNKIKKLKDETFMFISREININLKTLYPLLQCLSQLVLEFDAKYALLKKEKSLLDFNDLEHLCLEILTQIDDEGNIQPSRVAFEYRQQFEEIFVDEYQDSNMVQEVILQMISRSGSDSPNLFMVGDVKQSIYRFRQARPELFMEKYNKYGQESDTKNRKIQLYKNFRSRKEIIDGVNYIFKQIMSINIGEIDYTDEEALNSGILYAPLEQCEGVSGGSIELHLVDTEQQAEPEEVEDAFSEEGEVSNELQSNEELDAVQCEARVVARRIQQLMQPDAEGRLFKVYDKSLKAYRPVEYRDIVVLLRTTRNWADQFLTELEQFGIPVYADTGTGYFQTIEVQVMMSLLQVIDNPMQDIPLLAVLRSPIASFDPEELIDVRLVDRKLSFYEAMKKFAEQGNGQILSKTIEFMQRLDRWRDKALYTTTDELLWYLYNDTGYYSYVGSMPNGVQRQANLRILFERARQYEETSYKGLFNFINFINKLKSSSGDMGSAKILGENDNIVRIMSIHKSKGLEFPVTIVSGMGKKFNLTDMNRSILLHHELGFGPDFVDYKKRLRYPTAAKQALRAQIKLESLSEEMRILYVAFTRAKEKLIITGSIRDIEKAVGKWCACLDEKDMKLPEYAILKGSNYLDWIGPAVIRHKDCMELRKTAGITEESIKYLLDDGSRWSVLLWNRQDILGDAQAAQEMKKHLFDNLREWERQEEISEHYHDIYSRLEWNYPYEMSAKLPAKMSVTELKRQFDTEFAGEYSTTIFVPPLIKKPAFMEEVRSYTAAERGTILHAVMQHINLENTADIISIQRQVEAMVAAEFITYEQAKAVDVKRIAQFFHSALGHRLLRAKKVFREVAFHIELECTGIYNDLPKELYDQETILLQGVIDCYFEEQNEIVLIDYKTDYISHGNTDSIREKYAVQIEYYAKALERITGKRVKEKYIYLFYNGEILAF